MAAVERTWKAHPRQREFLRATEREVLYGGAGGGGKSDALLIAAAMRCGEYPGAHVLYLRREFPDLEISAIKRSLELFSGTGPAYNASAHRWLWPNGSRLQFGHVQREEDVRQYQSAEFDLIEFDEATEFTAGQYEFMITRNRSTRVPPQQWYMRAATNPGGIGHAWVKRRFVERARDRTHTDERGRTYRFIPAKASDNPTLPPDYADSLAGLSDENLRRAILDGDWDLFEGAAFPEWRWDIHTCEPFPIPADWLRFTSTDWGRNDECATHWWAVSPDRELVVYRERVARGIGARETARAILDLSQGEHLSYHAIGDDVDAQTGHEETTGDLMRREGYHYRAMPRAPGSRVASKQVLHDWLRVEERDGKPYTRLRVFRCCLRTIAEIPALVYDPHRTEDVVHSDIYDALRYGVMSRPHPARIEEKPLTGVWHAGELRMKGYSEAQIRRLRDQVKVIGR